MNQDKDASQELLNYSQEVENNIKANLNEVLRNDIDMEIYHYTNSNALINMLEKKSLWFTSSQFLNDTTEARNLKKNIINVLEHDQMVNFYYDSDRGQFFKEYIMNSFDFYIKEVSYECFVISFTTSKDVTNMWNGYAEGDGYCLTFDKNTLVDQLKNNTSYTIENLGKNMLTNLFHGKVIYDDKIKEEYLISILQDLYKYVMDTSFKSNNYELNELRDNLQGIMFSYLFLFSLFSKEKSFENEDEYRFINIISGANDTSIVKYRNHKGSIIPYIEMFFNGPFPSCNIEIGPKINMDFAKKGLEMLLNNKKNLSTVTKSNIPLRF